MNNKVESTADESIELVALMATKPQTEQEIDYYENMLIVSEEIYESIQKRIKVGSIINRSLVLGFIPIKTKHVLDELDISKLKLELQEIKYTVFNQKQYYQSWLDRKKDYDLRMDSVYRECNQNFDEVLEKAKGVTTNPRLPQVIKDYKNPTNDQELKVQFYLYLKQEINNFEVHGSKGMKVAK